MTAARFERQSVENATGKMGNIYFNSAIHERSNHVLKNIKLKKKESSQNQHVPGKSTWNPRPIWSVPKAFTDRNSAPTMEGRILALRRWTASIRRSSPSMPKALQVRGLNQWDQLLELIATFKAPDVLVTSVPSTPTALAGCTAL